MANYKIRQGDDWTIITPVYRTLQNYDYWAAMVDGENDQQSHYFADYEAWRITNGDKDEDAFISSLYPEGKPYGKVVLNLTGFDLKYDIMSGDDVAVTPSLGTEISERGENVDLRPLGRIMLSLNEIQTANLAPGTYQGQLQLTKDGVTESATADTITVIKQVTV